MVAEPYIAPVLPLEYTVNAEGCWEQLVLRFSNLGSGYIALYRASGQDLLVA